MKRFIPHPIFLYGIASWIVIIGAVLLATWLSGCTTTYKEAVLVEQSQVADELDYPVVVVVYGASWCPACRALDAEIPSLLAASPGRLKFVKVDSDKGSPPQVKYIPYFFVYRAGVKVYEGNPAREQLLHLIKE